MFQLFHCLKGGNLSPSFVNAYMDELNNTLNYIKSGCLMNGVTFNHLIYSDDLVLIAPSALQIILNYCDGFACEHGIQYMY